MTPSRRISRPAGLAAASILALLAYVAGVPRLVFAANVLLVTESFTGAQPSTPADWAKPSAPAGSNFACLTASSNSGQAPIPGCGSPADPSGSGALRLTSAGGGEEGGVGYTLSVPSTDGIDAIFDSYQYGGNGADGIGFYLAAANPSDPQPPSAIGEAGGALGYSINGGPGMTYGYLGIGLDAYGNYANSDYEGSTCPNPGWRTLGKAYAENVSVRGPGDGTTGYCLLASTASGNHAWTLRGTTRSNSRVPVEVVINPSASSATTASGLSVPAQSFEVAFTPLNNGGAKVTLSGSLPSASGIVPAAWLNSSTGIPYQLTFGWVGSTGGSTDVHEVNLVSSGTVTGVPPQLSASLADSASGAPGHGTQMDYDATVSNAGGAGDEAQTVTLTDTLPAGETAVNSGSGWSGGTDWTCSTSGQTVTCTDSSGIAAGNGASLSIPVKVTASAGSHLSDSVTVSSDDASPASASDSVTVAKAATAVTASANPSSTTYGNSVTLTASGLPSDATGTVTFTSGVSTLCSQAVSSGSASCALAAPGAGNYSPVTASYGGDANYLASTATTSFTVSPAATSMTASANPPTTAYGNQVTLRATGLPTGATGSVTFGAFCSGPVSSGSASCGTAVLPAGIYPVPAAYSGDTDYQSSIASTSFTITKASTSFTASASPSTTTYGNIIQLSAAGLPGGATGSVSFASGGSTLCAGTVGSGGASCGTAVLVPGTYPVTATYSGDSNYQGATASTSFTINKAPTSLTASATPATTGYGNTVQLSAAGLPGGATGLVSFTSSGSLLCASTVSAGSASCTTAVLGAGSYSSVTATYAGDSNYQSATASTSFTITAIPTSITAWVDPDTTGYGNTVQLSAAGLPVAATGTVTFTSGSTTLCSGTVSAGSAACTTAVLPAGSYSVTATYPGDGNFLGSVATSSFSITQDSTSFTASADPASTTYGNGVQLSAAGLPSDATGTVSFSSESAQLCSGSVGSGSASCDTGVLPAGAYPVTAAYSGDVNYASSTAATSFTINRASTAIAADANPSTTTYGVSVTLSATGLNSDAGGGVTFTSGGATLCSGTVVGGSASCGTGVLPVGGYSVTATYGGDGNYLGSTATTSFSITQAQTAVTASASPGSTDYGNSVTLTASGLPTDATGTVSFSDQSGPLCTTGQLSSGAASCSTGVLPAGNYDPVTASYLGDSNYLGSTATTSFTITQAQTAVAASASPDSTAYGDTVTLTASGLPTDATGTVSFSDQSGPLCTTGELSSGAASCSTPALLPVGNYDPVTASYPGDSNYLGSTATTSFTITKAETAVTASASPDSTTYGNSVTLTASGLPTDATGTVSFSDQSGPLCTTGELNSGSASCSTPATLPAGTYDPVTASYPGDANYLGSTATTSFTIAQAETAVTASASPDSTTYGNSVTLTASGLPTDATGTVSFTDQGGPLCTTGQLSSGSASCSTPAPLPGGTYDPVTASYPGDANYLGSTATTSFGITQAETAVTASASPDSTDHGTSVTLTAGGLPSDATGEVTFTTGSSALCAAPVSAGSASCSTAALLATGLYPVTASYAGDSDYLGSTATTSFTITPAAASFTAAAVPTSTPYGNTVTLTASGLPDDATGTVSFASGSVSLCSAAVDAGAADCATGTLGAGAYPVTATYSGDPNYTSAVASTSFTITKLPTSLTAAAAPPTVPTGRTVTLTASGLPADAAGTVTFSSGSETLCSAPLTSGSASCAATVLPPGSYSVIATYSGDSNHAGSSAQATFTVTADPILDISLSGMPAGAAPGSSYTLTLTASFDPSGGPAHNDPTLTASLPPGETFVSLPSPDGWTCALSAGDTVLTCTSTAGTPIPAGTVLPAVSVAVTISSTASGNLTTTAGLSDTADGVAAASTQSSVGVESSAPVPDTGTPLPRPWTLLVGIPLIAVGIGVLVRRRQLLPRAR